MCRTNQLLCISLFGCEVLEIQGTGRPRAEDGGVYISVIRFEVEWLSLFRLSQGYLRWLYVGRGCWSREVGGASSGVFEVAIEKVAQLFQQMRLDVRRQCICGHTSTSRHSNQIREH